MVRCGKNSAESGGGPPSRKLESGFCLIIQQTCVCVWICCVWMRSDDSVPNWCVVRGRKATSIRVVLVVRRAIQVATTKCYPTTGATSWSCPWWRFVRVKMDRSQSTGNADQSAAPPTRTNSSVSCNTTTSGTGTGKDGELVRSDWAAFLILGGYRMRHHQCFGSPSSYCHRDRVIVCCCGFNLYIFFFLWELFILLLYHIYLCAFLNRIIFI